MNISLKEGFTFTPTWNGNDKEKKEDQIKVKFKFLSGSDLYECLDDEGKSNKKAEWSKICTGVENLEIDGTKAKPEDIININGLASLYSECYLAYTKRTAVSKKK